MEIGKAEGKAGKETVSFSPRPFWEAYRID